MCRTWCNPEPGRTENLCLNTYLYDCGSERSEQAGISSCYFNLLSCMTTSSTVLHLPRMFSPDVPKVISEYRREGFQLIFLLHYIVFISIRRIKRRTAHYSVTLDTYLTHVPFKTKWRKQTFHANILTVFPQWSQQNTRMSKT